jgi:hypothetical protein
MVPARRRSDRNPADLPMSYALEQQRKILESYRAANAEAHDEYQRRVLAGATLTMEGRITGPYTTHTTYFLSDGSSWTIVTPSSLAWAFNTLIIKYA